HADSQLKHVVGISMYECGTLRGCAFASYSTWWSHSDTGGKLRRCSWLRIPGRSGSFRLITTPFAAGSGQRHVLTRSDEHAFVGGKRELHDDPARQGRHERPGPADRG